MPWQGHRKSHRPRQTWPLRPTRGPRHIHCVLGSSGPAHGHLCVWTPPPPAWLCPFYRFPKRLATSYGSSVDSGLEKTSLRGSSAGSPHWCMRNKGHPQPCGFPTLTLQPGPMCVPPCTLGTPNPGPFLWLWGGQAAGLELQDTASGLHGRVKARSLGALVLTRRTTACTPSAQEAGSLTPTQTASSSS